MNASVYLSGAIMVAFMVAATGWSVSRAINGKGIWRLIHLTLALAMLGGAASIFLDQSSYGMLLGILLVLLSLLVMFVDKSENRWLIVIQFISGVILAAGIPFGAT